MSPNNLCVRNKKMARIRPQAKENRSVNFSRGLWRWRNVYIWFYIRRLVWYSNRSCFSFNTFDPSWKELHATTATCTSKFCISKKGSSFLNSQNSNGGGTLPLKISESRTAPPPSGSTHEPYEIARSSRQNSTCICTCFACIFLSMNGKWNVGGKSKSLVFTGDSRLEKARVRGKGDWANLGSSVPVQSSAGRLWVHLLKNTIINWTVKEKISSINSF
jgi:hypothetical protein